MLELKKTYLPELERMRSNCYADALPCVNLLIALFVGTDREEEQNDKILPMLKALEEDIKSHRWMILSDKEEFPGHFFCWRVFRGAKERQQIPSGVTHLLKAYAKEGAYNAVMVAEYIESCVFQLKDELAYSLRLTEKQVHSIRSSEESISSLLTGTSQPAHKKVSAVSCY